MFQLTERAFQQYLGQFKLSAKAKAVRNQFIEGPQGKIPVFTGEFWTAKQRQANALHEVSYRACFKPQLPEFFIQQFTRPGDWVYDPFNGRGTTTIQAALMGRSIIANDVNPLSLILTRPRVAPPELTLIKQRLDAIDMGKPLKADINLSAFYHKTTLAELVGLRNYLIKRKQTHKEDDIDRWIRMVATNRLTGHSKGFFSVYTLPPNQAVTAERQLKINRDRKQKPEYRNVKELIYRKSRLLLKDMDNQAYSNLKNTQGKLLNGDAARTPAIASGTVALTVTSPPFLDIVQYAGDNWLRCWFNNIDVEKIAGKITMSRTVDEWATKMRQVFNELYRITKAKGVVAFEVGELRNRSIKLEDVVIPLGINAGFKCMCVMINQQVFTKTANIWGISNNSIGTNTNRIIVFSKG